LDIPLRDIKIWLLWTEAGEEIEKLWREVEEWGRGWRRVGRIVVDVLLATVAVYCGEIPWPYFMRGWISPPSSGQ
jgi:hypothetical protein